MQGANDSEGRSRLCLWANPGYIERHKEAGLRDGADSEFCGVLALLRA